MKEGTYILMFASRNAIREEAAISFSSRKEKLFSGRRTKKLTLNMMQMYRISMETRTK